MSSNDAGQYPARRPPGPAIDHLPTLLALAALASAAYGQHPEPIAGEGEARDVTAAGFAFLELRTARSAYHAGEPIRVTLRFGFEEAFFAESLVPLFRTPLEVPVQIEAPWMRGLPGLVARAAAPTDEQGAERCVLNQEVAGARRVDEQRADGRKLRAFELERTFFALAPGELALPAARLSFAVGTRFGEQLLQENSVEDRALAFVVSAPRTLAILALPEQGRPPGFTGAVGRLTLRTEATPREALPGANVRLRIHVEGDGNLERFDAPRLEVNDDWRVLGTIEERSAARRTIEFDLAPAGSGALRTPQLALAYFDTTPPAGYRTLVSEALEIAVAGRPPAAGPEPRPGGARRNRRWLAAGAAPAALLVWLAVRRRRRRAQDELSGG